MYKYSVKISIIPFLDLILLAIGILAWGSQILGSEEQIWREGVRTGSVCCKVPLKRDQCNAGLYVHVWDLSGIGMLFLFHQTFQMCNCRDRTSSQSELIASRVQYKQPNQNDETGCYLASRSVKGCLSELWCCATPLKKGKAFARDTPYLCVWTEAVSSC